MFGFPFFTSLIVTVAMVIGFSFVINKGIQKKRTEQEDLATPTKDAKQDLNCHA